MSCLLGDSFVLLARASSPVGDESRLVRQELEPLFQSHFKALRRQLSEGTRNKEYLETLERSFYKPRTYFSLGRFDLLVVALLDDVEFPIRAFRPFDPRKDSRPRGEEAQPFDHQVMVCPLPRFRKRTNNDGANDSLKAWNDAMMAADELPLIGMSQLKLNMLVGACSGVEFLRAVFRVLRLIEGPADLPAVRCLALESYPWHEIVLLTWSSSFESIARLIRTLASLRVGAMCDLLDSSSRGLEHEDREVNADLARRIRSDARALGASLRKSGADVRNGAGRKVRVGSRHMLDRHVLIHTTTSLGVDLSTLTRKNYRSIHAKDDLCWSSRWFVESGHHLEAQDALRTTGRKRKPTSANIFGKGDVWCPTFERSDNSRSLAKAVWENREALLPLYGVKASQTDVAIRLDSPESRPVNAVDYHGTYARALTIPYNRILRLHNLMLSVAFCKVTASRMLNMISVFNDAVSDNIMLSSISELQPFVDWTLDQCEQDLSAIRQGKLTPSPTDVVKWANERIDQFEHAFRNRYRSSHRHGDLSEVNLDFRGGVQQLLTAHHGALNATAMALKMAEPGIAWMGGRAGPFISPYCSSLHLNPLHAFQPEYFAAVLGHELAHRWLHGLDQDPSLREAARGLRARLGDEQAAVRHFPKQHAELGKHLMLSGSVGLLEQAVCDLAGFHFSFAGDTQLFLWWNLNVFHQFGDLWRPGATWPRPLSCCRFLIRMYIVLETVAPTEDAHEQMLKEYLGSGRQLEWRKLPFVPGELLPKFVSRLMGTKTGRWIRDLNRALSKLHADTIPGDPRSRASFETAVGSATENLKNGSVATFRPKTRSPEKEAFLFSHGLLVAYLRLIACADEWKPAILRRKESDGLPTADTVRSGPPILFDQRGGTFIGDAAVRREYAMWRATLVNSLWDMAVRQKSADWIEKIRSISRKR